MPDRPLLMIPGPVELSDAVLAASGVRPPSHVAPAFIEAFGDALGRMRLVWRAPADHQPFVVAGGGTIAMEACATNLVDPGEAALVVVTGVFGDRMAEMLRRRGAVVHVVRAAPGDVVTPGAAASALAARPFKALFATHVDTSTGVRVDAAGLAAVARAGGVLSCFDGVCATAGETFEMGAWGADVYLTASQKALGLPAGLALWVASPAALETRRRLVVPPPLSLDWEAWLPVLRAYEARAPSYFSTPATTLVWALREGLRELVPDGCDPAAAVAARVERTARAARAVRAGMAAIGVGPVPASAESTAHTLSALRFPPGIGPTALAAIAAEGVTVAGGLHPELRATTFRIGHMGHVVDRPDLLRHTVVAVAAGLRAAGHHGRVDDAVAAADAVLGS